MNDYVLNKKPEPASNDMVWAFDLGHPLRLERCPSLAGAGEGGRRPGEGRRGKAFLGGGDRGEVSNPVNQKTEVNTIHQFLHQASLPWRDEVKRRRLTPTEFAETKTAAGRRRMWRTRQTHGSPRPSPARGGIFVAAIGKDFQAPCRSDRVAVRKDYAAPTALGRMELKIPIKFSTRFGNERIQNHNPSEKGMLMNSIHRQNKTQLE
jgi:hypothetical protein